LTRLNLKQLEARDAVKRALQAPCPQSPPEWHNGTLLIQSSVKLDISLDLFTTEV